VVSSRELSFCPFCCVGATLEYFDWQRNIREAASRSEAAPTNGRFVSVSDGVLYIQEAGTVSDQPVLFIHGVGAWSELWRETLDQCQAHDLYCIGVDLPPFGFSEIAPGSHYDRVSQSRRILELMRQLHPQAPFALVGHSFGAGPTVEAVMRDPTQVRALVIVDGALGIDQSSGDPGLLGALVSQRSVRNKILSATVTNPMLSKQLLLALIYNKDAATDGRVKVLQAPLVVDHATDRLGDWALEFVESSGEDAVSKRPEFYSRVTMPTLIIWGIEDTITPLPQGERFRDLVGHSKFVPLPNVGHIPQIEDTDAFNSTLFEFLQGLK
jgi:pimeloyl-ACP methyl ester carboxylesterase